VKLVAQVVNADGSPLAKGSAEMVTVQDGRLRVAGRGRVAKGRLSVPSEVVAQWALRIDGQAVLAAPVAVQDDTLDLGEIRLLAEPLALPAFHAEDGLVHGLPGVLAQALAARTAAPEVARATTTLDTGTTAAVDPKAGISFGTMLGSSAKQLSGSVAQEAGFRLKSASITLKGVPTASEESIGLVFPSAEDMVKGGLSLSELSFELNPRSDAVAAPPPPSGPVVPLLTGYTRELALRKLAGLGYLVQVHGEIVREAGLAGRVVRQLPAPKTTHPAGAMVSLFVGKSA
jgi:hypothetical protein